MKNPFARSPEDKVARLERRRRDAAQDLEVKTQAFRAANHAAETSDDPDSAAVRKSVEAARQALVAAQRVCGDREAALADEQAQQAADANKANLDAETKRDADRKAAHAKLAQSAVKLQAAIGTLLTEMNSFRDARVALGVLKPTLATELTELDTRMRAYVGDVTGIKRVGVPPEILGAWASHIPAAV
jgi:hypothetical protein